MEEEKEVEEEEQQGTFWKTSNSGVRVLIEPQIWHLPPTEFCLPTPV